MPLIEPGLRDALEGMSWLLGQSRVYSGDLVRPFRLLHLKIRLLAAGELQYKMEIHTAFVPELESLPPTLDPACDIDNNENSGWDANDDSSDHEVYEATLRIHVGHTEDRGDKRER